MSDETSTDYDPMPALAKLVFRKQLTHNEAAELAAWRAKMNEQTRFFRGD